MERPQVSHTATSPDLTGHLNPNWQRKDVPTFSGLDSSISNDTDEGEVLGSQAQELLHLLKNKSSTLYRDILFEPRYQTNPDYVNRISFDTIDIHIKDDVDPDFADDEHALYRKSLHPEPDYSRGRGRDKDFLSVSDGGRSPGASPIRMKSPSRMDMAAFFGNHIKYPTTPIVTRRCALIARMHKDFERLYLGQLLNKGLLPVLPRRVILIYISARKHTWVAIDWIMQNFVQNGDSIVIVASLPQALGKSKSSRRNFGDPYFAPKTERIRQRQRNQPDYIRQIALNIMSYALCVVNPKVICRVVVEIAEGKTKDVLKDMYKLYEPNIACTGSRANRHSSAPLRSWDSSRVSDRLVKNFPLPVIVVPAMNLCDFEEHLKVEISGKTSSVESTDPQPHVTEGSQNSDDDGTDTESLSDESLSSEQSADSESSAGSYTSFDEIAGIYTDYKARVSLMINDMKSQELNEDYYSNFIKTISDQSLKFCEELRGVDPDFRGKGAVLAREITGSNLFGAVPYKTKSLLPPIEKPTTQNSNATPGISYSEMKKNLKLNAEKAKERAQSPTLEEDGFAKTPKSRKLKFADSEKPSRLAKPKPLMKFLSNEDPSSRKMKIAPSHSHPDMHVTPDSGGDGKKKKKKRNFWKIF